VPRLSNYCDSLAAFDELLLHFIYLNSPEIVIKNTLNLATCALIKNAKMILLNPHTPSTKAAAASPVECQKRKQAQVSYWQSNFRSMHCDLIDQRVSCWKN